jgi:hypothetical protein
VHWLTVTGVPRTCAHKRCESRINWEALTHTHPRADPPSAGTLQGVPPLCCGRRVAVLSGVCSNRPSRGSGTTGKQPANLAVEGAEESLSILSDYTTTVRPPPKRS